MPYVDIDYTNWKGNRSIRRIIPQGLIFSETAWHLEKQWLVLAWDVEKDAWRKFAMKDVHSWTPVNELP